MKTLRTREVNSFSPVARIGRAGIKIQTGCFSANAAISGLSDLVVLWSLPACPPALHVSSYTLTAPGPLAFLTTALCSFRELDSVCLPPCIIKRLGAGSAPHPAPLHLLEPPGLEPTPLYPPVCPSPNSITRPFLGN